MTEPRKKPRGSRLFAGAVMGFLLGGLAYVAWSFAGLGGPMFIAGSALVGFGLGYVLGLFLTEVLLGLFS